MGVNGCVVNTAAKTNRVAPVYDYGSAGVCVWAFVVSPQGSLVPFTCLVT